MLRGIGESEYEGFPSASAAIPGYNAMVMVANDVVDGADASVGAMLYPLDNFIDKPFDGRGCVDAIIVKVIVLGGMNVRLELKASANVAPKG